MIRSDETEIIGNWIKVGEKIVGDVACERVHQLTVAYLNKIGRDWTGWETLYRNPADDRFWLHTYPLGHMHGGGPPALINLSEDEARLKFPELFSSNK